MNPNFVFPAMDTRPKSSSISDRSSFPSVARRFSTSIITAPSKALTKLERNVRHVKQIVDAKSDSIIERTHKHRKLSTDSISRLLSPPPPPPPQHTRPQAHPVTSATEIFNRRRTRNRGRNLSFSTARDISHPSRSLSPPRFLGKGLYTNIPQRDPRKSEGLGNELKSHSLLNDSIGQFTYPVPCHPIPCPKIINPNPELRRPRRPSRQFLETDHELISCRNFHRTDQRKNRVGDQDLDFRIPPIIPPLHFRPLSPPFGYHNRTSIDQVHQNGSLSYKRPDRRFPQLSSSLSSSQPQPTSFQSARLRTKRQSRPISTSSSSIYSTDWREYIMSEYEDPVSDSTSSLDPCSSQSQFNRLDALPSIASGSSLTYFTSSHKLSSVGKNLYDLDDIE